MPVLRLIYPFHGAWLVQNSPADRVPSHGTTAFASSLAIDFTPVTAEGRSAPMAAASWLRPEEPERFPGFGRRILAPVDGTVVAVRDAETDHRAHRGLPSVRYALTQGARARQGWAALAGNHVLIRRDGGGVVALCHLQQGSAEAGIGDRVSAGDAVARCGNSGNSTEPHLHVQAMSDADPARADPVPLSFPDGLPRNGTVIMA